MYQFNDLKIVSYDPARVMPSQRGTGMWQHPLHLSETPPGGWITLLEARYAQSLSGNKRSIKVQGGSIYVDCVPEELPAILEDLKPMVLQTNEEYRAEQVRLALQRETSEGTASAVKQRLEDVKKLLNFD